MNTPEDFPFPFEPYLIQKDFMKKLYETIENKKFGIFESPTGTGKSLSIICGVLTWLRDHEANERKRLEELASLKESLDDDDDDWFSKAAEKAEIREQRFIAKTELDQLKIKDDRINKLLSQRLKIKQKNVRDLNLKFNKLFKNSSSVNLDLKTEEENEILNDADQFLVNDYFSDDNEDEEVEDSAEDIKEDFGTKIIFCSRTHSQLSQFVKEIQKSVFGDDIRLVVLASRQNLCINSLVLKLQHSNLINERCRDLQKGKNVGKKSGKVQSTKTKKQKIHTGCPYFKHGEMQNFRDQVLIETQDIEQLVFTGKKNKACPYYSTRMAIRDSQVLVLPYNTILHSPTREACGISLRNSVLIIDEAHNLLETISHIHSVEISEFQLSCTHSQLLQYMNKYKLRLKAKNLLYIKQLIFIISNFIKILSGSVGADSGDNVKESSRMISLLNFMTETQMFNLNIYKLLSYCEKSKIAQKLQGFVCFQNDNHGNEKKNELDVKTGVVNFLANLNNGTVNGSKPVEELENTEPSEDGQSLRISSQMPAIIEFLTSLSNNDADSRIIISKALSIKKSSLKYLLLNSSCHFTSIVQQCRSVIVAGGTMQPVEEFRDQLFISAGVELERISYFSCGHVIPEDNLLAVILTNGASGQKLDFSYNFRNEKTTLDNLGQTLINACNIIPAGVVCFFPSYEYEKTAYEYFEKTGIIKRLSNKKRIFREPKKSSQLDDVLNGFSKVVAAGTESHASNRQTGALLFSVVGGKMSEGINFSDDLGRCIIMVGLPYPNLNSPELKEKMSYLDKNVSPGKDGRTAGRVFYENLCMKAVNQSIGRAIRHRQDYASILLLDWRYTKNSVRSLLPSWIQKSLSVQEKFGPVIPKLKNFYSKFK